MLSSEIRRPISARAPPGAAQAVAAAAMSGGVVGTIDDIETGSLLLSRIRPQSEFARLKSTVGKSGRCITDEYGDMDWCGIGMSCNQCACTCRCFDACVVASAVPCVVACGERACLSVCSPLTHPM